MRIIGGNFGLSGSAYISRDKKLVIDAAQKSIYSSGDIISITANEVKEKKFGILGFIVGAILLSIFLGIFLSFLGVIIAVIIAIAGSFYSDKRNIVELNFNDNKKVTLECTPRSVKQLFKFSPQ